MKVIDLNVLLYAVNRDSAHHVAARRWLETALSSDDTIALPWTVILGFLRITTNARVLPHPLAPDDALAVVDSLLARPNVAMLNPGNDHWRVLRRLLVQAGTAANLTTDAHLAALAVEHGADLVSTDADFARFDNVAWVNPLAS